MPVGSWDQGMRDSTAEDLPAIRSLLTEASLPTADLGAGLLRSLVVAPYHRKRGLGRRLVDTVEGHAKAAGLKQLALLTETADRFFEAFGYRLVDRHNVPDEIRQSAEFRTLCPLSARCMAKVIA